MFVDKVKVSIEAGQGGDGAVSFRHEKFVDRGGPDGGDGGKGGDVIFKAASNQDTLANFRYQKELKAEPGQGGSKRRRHGKSGHDLIVAVPVGTVVNNEDGEVLADLISEDQSAVVAKGGKGGFGNAHFVSSTRQAPRVGEKGEAGHKLNIVLELKMIADVGLVGLPNAGKSTLLAHVSNAHPEIADYPFTTLTPNLGVVDIDKKTSLLFADIPGLIEGASKGKGLGDEFLRHLERTSVLLHLIDVYTDNIVAAYKTIQAELKAYRIDLTTRPQLVILTKIEGVDKKTLQAKMTKLQKVLPKTAQVFAISSMSQEGLKELLFATQKLVLADRKKKTTQSKKQSPLPIIKLETDDAWEVTKTDDGYMVSGQKIERFAERTDFNSYHGQQRLRDIMRKMGIMHELVRQGIEPGQNIRIGQNSLGY